MDLAERVKQSGLYRIHGAWPRHVAHVAVLAAHRVSLAEVRRTVKVASEDDGDLVRVSDLVLHFPHNLHDLGSAIRLRLAV